MSVEQLLSQFDVALPQEVVRDVQASGVPFTREIWGEGTGKRDLLGCIILDKSDQDVVRLKFNVYNKAEQEGTSQDSQTDHSGALQQQKGETSDTSVQAQQDVDAKKSQTEALEQAERQQQTEAAPVGVFAAQTESNGVESSYMQTDELEQFDQVSQTDEEEKKQLDDSFMQTDVLDQFEQVTQTESPALNESFIQTDPLPVSEQCEQTDPPDTCFKQIQVVWPTKTSKTQTDSKKLLDTPMQTELEVFEQVCQTDNAPLTDGEVQASVEMFDNIAQTDIKEFSDCPVQTEVKVLQKGSQTLKPPVKHKGSATDPMIVIDPEDQFDMDTQTDPMRVIDPSTDREACTQTEVGKVIYPEIMFDNVCQTDEVKVVTLETQAEGGAQTDFVFVTQPEDLQENVVQTDDVTIINPETQVSQEQQTNLVWVVGLQQDENADREIEAAASPSAAAATTTGEAPLQVDTEGIPGLGGEGLMAAPPLDMEAPLEQQHHQGTLSAGTAEQWVQTEPVTIIIGDSSFLLQQLANINKSPEAASPQTIPPRRKAGRPAANNSIYNRNRQDGNPPLLERQAPGDVGVEPQHAADGLVGGVGGDPVALPGGEMPTLEAEGSAGGQHQPAVVARKGVRMLLPNQQQQPPVVKKNPYRGPYSVSGMKPQRSQAAALQDSGGAPSAMQQHLDEVTAGHAHITTAGYQDQPAAAGHSEFLNTSGQQQLHELDDAKVTGGAGSGKFNCPFCTATFDDTPQLYKHIHEDHGTPRCSTRKARRKGTIIVDDDGSMHIVGEQNTLWELNEENLRRYKRAKRYSPRTSKYTPRVTMATEKDDTAALFRDDEDAVPSVTPLSGLGQDVHHLVSMPTVEDGELTLQIVQNGANSAVTQSIVKQHAPTTIPVTTPIQISEPATPPVEKTLSEVSAAIGEVPESQKREYHCPQCPRIFTKTSELYSHLQHSHKHPSQRGRGRGRGAYHQLHIVDTADLQEQEPAELLEGQPAPAVIQLQQQQVLGLLPDTPAEEPAGEEQQEVEIRVEYRDEGLEEFQPQPQQMEPQQPQHVSLDAHAMPLAPPPEPIMHEEEPEPEVEPEPEPEPPELEEVRVVKRGRGRPPKVRREETEAETPGRRGAKRRLEEEESGPVLVVTDGEGEVTPRRRGRSAGGGESPAKRPPGRPPGKRGRKH